MSAEIRRLLSPEAVSDLLAYGEEEATHALTRQDRDQYQFWQGWNAALQRLAAPAPQLEEMKDDHARGRSGATDSATGSPRSPHPDGSPQQTMADAAEMLWIVLANVSEGDWTKQTPDWQEAAARRRDNYFAALKSGAVALPIAVDPVVERGTEGLRAHPLESSALTSLAAPAQEDEPPDA